MSRNRLRRSLVFDELHDVLLGDAAAESGAGDLREADTVFAGDLADERRGAGFFVLVLGRGCGGRHGRRRRSLLFFFGGRCRWRGRGFGRRCGRLGCSGFAVHRDGADDRVHANGCSFGDFDFLQDSGGGRGNFGIDFVGRNFEERLVALDFVSGLLQPLGDGAFDDGFAHLGHDDVSWHEFLP